MLQRVMIASTLMTDPRLLLADEPTTALDVTTQEEVVAILDALRRERGVALIFITHDLDLAAAICERTAVFYAGEIVDVQASATLHDDPLHPYMAGLAAARPDISSSASRLQVIKGNPLVAYEAPTGCRFAPRCPHVEDRCRSGPIELEAVASGLPPAPHLSILGALLILAVVALPLAICAAVRTGTSRLQYGQCATPLVVYSTRK